MKRIRSGFTGALAFFASAALHAVLVGGIIYASRAPQNAVKTDKAGLEMTQKSAYALLPDVEVISSVSSLKRSDISKTTQAPKEDFGAAKAQTAAGGDNDKSVFMYQDAVKRRIQEARLYPEEARKEGTQGSVEVAFSILPDGLLDRVSLIKSSGSEVLDAEAISTMKRASPFPAYAGTINNRAIDMQVAIVFKLN